MSSRVRVEVTFRDLREADIETGTTLCRASNWNQTRRDWELFLRLSPHGCRVAVKDDRVIGTVTTVRYEDRFAWIGMVLVDPVERRKGIGALLMSEALETLKDMPSIRLDATPAGHEVYRKLNFADEYRLSRMKILVSTDLLVFRGHAARPMTTTDFPSVAALDREVFGADRRLTLEWMFDGASEYAWVVEGTGGIAGYMFGRHGFNCDHLGPVIAHEEETARRLLSECLSQHAGQSFILDAPHIDTGWRSWLESIGFHEQRPFIRMFYRDNPYPGMPPQQFGILGPEFG